MEMAPLSFYRTTIHGLDLSIDVNQQQAVQRVNVEKSAITLDVEQVQISQEGRKQLQDDIISQPARRFFSSDIDNALSQALAEQPEQVSLAVYRIIDENFMNSSAVSGEQRQASLALGLSQAAYLAEHYINDDQKLSFLDTMKQIAAISQTRTTDKTGNVSYDNPPSYIPGTTEYKVEWSVIMKEKEPERYEKYREALESGDAVKGLEEFISFVKTAAIKHPDWGREYQSKAARQVNELKHAEISNPFADIDLSTSSGFMSGALDVLKSAFNEQTLQYSVKRIEQFFASLPDISR
ncbi:hypothetical protein LHL03_18915 [Pectobacterium carotovorum]|uniref:hypothetical protein n=1 Tax=Pectobacterium carotovorum TaxID=554 RepID=UPI0010FD1E4E|nr:hypothetical protein [Pectobacterium carotovorum]KAA3669711.1 hypothetical protein FEV48_00280 [Pectobacterium carotovorum subsp. carotovorum]UCZ79056.1 hypothetical protein LHL03_18915 [Pectobacterium carotovorum]